MMSEPDRLENDERVDREQQIRCLVDDLRARRERGEAVDDDLVIAAHPELSPDLERRIRLARLARRARHRIEAGDADTVSPQDPSTHDSEPGSLQIRCPHCRRTGAWPPDALLAPAVCPNCGEQFSLIDDREETRSAPAVRRLAHFELVEQIGAGGFGTVWKARDLELDRVVAVKIPRPDRLAPEDIDKFLREARSAAAINHPNIVRIYEAGRAGETVYLVSELVRGVPLSEWMADRRPTLIEAVGLCQTIAAAVHQAHVAGVVHRDLKPANIMIDGQGQPHITDFGLAKREQGEVTVTIEGQVLGTPAYMSPEQASGHAHRCDARTDVYGVGVMLFELLTDELPFRGKSSMLLFQIMHDEPPSPRKFNARVPRDLETICLKCMDKDPGRRYATAAELAGDLGRCERGEPIQARPVGRLLRGARWCQRNRRVAALLATVFLLLAMVAAGSLVFSIRLAGAQRKTAAAEARANANFKKAQQAVDGMLTELGMDALTVEPQLTPLRRALLERALDFYEKLSAEEGRDPAVRMETGQAHRNVAMVSEYLGDLERAVREYELCAEILEPLVNDYPRHVPYRALLGRCRTDAGRLASQRRDPQTAAQRYAQAVELLTAAPDRSHPRIRQELARARHRIGVLLASFGQLENALTELQAARQLQRKLVDDEPGAEEYQSLLCVMLHDLANVLSELPGRRPESERLFVEALDRCRMLVKQSRFPNVLEYQARLLMDLANLQSFEGRYDEAHNNNRDAIEHLTQLVRDYPHVPGYQLLLGNAQGNLAYKLSNTSPDEAEVHFELAVRTLETLVERTPSMPEYQEALAQVLNNQGILQFARNKDKAQASFEQAHQIWIARSRELEDNATYHRWAGAAVHNLGMILRSTDRLEARRRFQQAMEHQRAALRIDAHRPTSRSFLANHLVDLALTFDYVEQGREMLPLLEEGLQLTADLVRDFPTAPYYQTQHVRMCNELAWMLVATSDLELRDTSRAVQLAEQAVAMRPEEAAFWNTLGVAAYRLQKWPRAAEALREAVERNQGADASDLLYLSMTYVQLGRLAEARESYEQALLLHATTPPDDSLQSLRREAARLLGVQ